MIKRSSANKMLPSLVNDAQNEHFNIAEGIRTDVPVTHNKSVIKSVNFINEPDGSYTLRPPLILKEEISPRTWYLYDKIHTLAISNTGGFITITNPNDGEDVAHIILKYFDKTIKPNEAEFTMVEDYSLSFISEVISVNNFKDYTLIGAKINLSRFSTYMEEFNTNHTTNHATDLVYLDTNYQTLDNGDVYRLIKIRQDTNSPELSWIIEIIYPELNTITSSTSTEAVLEVNLLADNPYAVRDLYGYGYVSTTKVLPYIPFNFTENQIKEHTVCRLTESVPVSIGGGIQGYKLLVSASPKSLGNSPMILKAFLTTAKTDSVYYGVWEESSNEGADWKVCPEFLSKFEDKLIKKYVSDLTSEDFENIAYQESLDQAATYLVEKQLVRLNYKFDGNVPADLAETDLIKNRPDVLFIQSPNLSKRYRFQVYIDTLKETPTPSNIDKTYAIYGFTTTNGDIDPEYATYTTLANAGQKDASSDSSGTFEGSSAEIINNCLCLYPAQTGLPGTTSSPATDLTRFGNAIAIQCTKRSANSYIKRVVITVGSNDCSLNCVTSANSFTNTTFPAATLVTKNSSISFDFSASPSNNNIYIVNRAEKANGNTAVAQILSIKIVYSLEGKVQTTSVYLASTTGMVQIPYSESTVLADNLQQERKQLFYGKTFDYNEQIILFNKYNLFSSRVDSTIFSALKTIQFSTEIVNVINWRNYLLVFTEKDISLLRYDTLTDSYLIKVLSTSIGVPKKDAKTIVCILNSVYFKSGYKIYKLVPNLYASADDILNLHTVSDQVDNLIEETLSPESETQNFVYANAYSYYLFTPIVNKGITYCFVYDYNKKIWNFYEYPVVILSVENLGLSEEYLKTENGIYYFKDKLNTLLNKELLYHPLDIGYEDDEEMYSVCANIDGVNLEVSTTSDQYTRMLSLIPRIPYADFLDTTLVDIYLFLESNAITISDTTDKIEDPYSDSYIQMYPIKYLIDFGQKSSNYTVFKTFLETKMTLATLSEKDAFPFEVYITADGIESPLHWDITTDSALWKDSFLQKGTLSTLFQSNNSEYDGIMRQLIIKYSGKGKTIHHVITGKSKYNFKFYSMDVRSRILPKKQ